MALSLQIQVKDAVRQVDAAISDEAVPDGDQTACLFRSVGPLEIFIHDRADRIDRGQDVPRGGFFERGVVPLE